MEYKYGFHDPGSWRILIHAKVLLLLGICGYGNSSGGTRHGLVTWHIVVYSLLRIQLYKP
jgi:hypothetical protein